jgi:protein-S-isoprenylcysteine O-methyltransferase Ste14
MKVINPALKYRTQNYLANLFYLSLAVFFYLNNKYYQQDLTMETKITLKSILVFYVIYGLIYNFLIPLEKLTISKGMELTLALKKSYYYMKKLTDKKHYLNIHHQDEVSALKPTKTEKNIMLFTLVKLFFLPLMINFFFINFKWLLDAFSQWQQKNFEVSIISFNNSIFPLLLAIFIITDVSFFIFGYTTESALLKNKIRSVEPTALGWFVALICYPPFNSIIGNYVSWYANDFNVFNVPIYDFILKIVEVILWLVYCWASIALGSKCSNLTNRGIVAKGPYKYIRHPAYISKNSAWALSTLPLLVDSTFSQIIAILCSLIFWGFIYYMRSVTEERHLSQDPDYLEYCQKVPYRFIPKLI